VVRLEFTYIGTSPEDVEEERARLARVFSLKEEGKLIVIRRRDGTVRELSCIFAGGLNFDSESRPCSGSYFSDFVRLVATDPYFRDPNLQSASGNFNGSVEVEIAVENSGDIMTYPIITITGEVQNPRIEMDSGEYLYFPDYTVSAGEQLSIDCQEGTVTLSDGTSVIGELAPGSSFFYIPSGSHSIYLTCAAGTSSVTISWYNRYRSLQFG